MSSLESWLHPLRAYPPALVLMCFAAALAAFLWFFAKILKWSIYTVAMVTFAVLTGVFALWLWA